MVNKEINERLNRIKAIKFALSQSSGSPIKRAIAVISLDLGISKSKAEEFIELFKEAGYITIKGENFIWAVENENLLQ